MRDFLLPPGRLIWVSRLRIHPTRVEWCGQPVALSYAQFRVVDAMVQQPGKPLSVVQMHAIVRDRPELLTRRADDAMDVDVAMRAIIKKIRDRFHEIDPAFEEIIAVPPRSYAWRNHALPVEQMIGEAA